MLNSISNPKNLSLLLIALTVLFIFPAGSAYAVWLEVEKLLAADGATDDSFGNSVSISGDYAIVGASDDDANSGSAYIFYHDGTSWSQQAKLTAADGAAGDRFGVSVSISGDYAIVGAYEDDDNGSLSGSAYIFKRDGTSWSEQAKLLASDGAGGDRFGFSVSISGDYAIVGAYQDDDNGSLSGSAYIFKRDGTSWSQQNKLLAADGAVLDLFGFSVSISGDYAIVGAYRHGAVASGSAYIFKRDGTIWSQQAKLLAADGAQDDYFGRSVSISGDYAVVGALYDDDNGGNSGSAYIFKRDGTSWSEQAKLFAADGAAGDRFGNSVSISGDYAIVGAYDDDDNGDQSGSAYIFERSGTNWSQQAKLTAADGAAEDYFGWSVSINGDYAIVGARYDDDNGTDSGSAYTYRRTSEPEIYGTKWHDTTTDEEPIEGWRIYIDENENGQFDAGEPNDITDSEGNYVLTASAAGTWLVTEEDRSCWEQTWPGGDGTYSVTLEAGEIATGYNFGNARATDIHLPRSAFQQDQKDKLLASDGAASDWFGWSVSINGDYAIVGAYEDDDNGSNSGSAYIFTPNDVDPNNWDQVAKLTASDGAADDRFGCSVSISGAYAIVGARGDDDNGTDSGSAYIFTPNDVDPNNWDQVAKLTASDGAVWDGFGFSVSISGDYAVVGALYDDDNAGQSGSAYIFKRSGTSWSEQAKLLAADGAASDHFGRSVYISGDYAIVGAGDDDDNGPDSGSAYIFKRDGTSWSQQDKLLAADGYAEDYFGDSVSISGDYAIVGAYGTITGSAYIFYYDGASWSQQAKLTAADGDVGHRFGYSVSISGDYAVVGAYGDDDSGNYSGSAYIFKRDWTYWSQKAKLVAADGAPLDYFGYSVSVSGDYAVVGANLDDDNGSASGSAYMFGKVPCPTADLTGDCFVDFIDFAGMANVWLPAFAFQQDQQDKLVASDGAASDWFGYSVSVSGDYVIVGAYFDDDNGSSSGSAYMFTPNDVNCAKWDENAKLTAADGAAYDYFGWSVSISGDYAIVGASGDDDNGSGSGSAYIFTPNDVYPNNWDQVAKLTASDGAADDRFGCSVYISGDYAVVGAHYDDDNGGNSGSAYIFKRDGTSWSEQAKLLATDGAVGDRFGDSVSISGDYAVVGAYLDDDSGTDSGSAYIFYYNGTSWSQQAKLLAVDGAAYDYLGCSVSVSGDYAVVGAYGDGDNGSYSGSAYIFERSGTSWPQQAKLTAADGAGYDYFGGSVSVSGTYAIVGAYGDDDNGSYSGSAYIFERDGTSWSEQAKWVASDGAAGDRFGFSVSISGDNAVVGARYDDDNGTDSGSAYMFGKVLCPSADLTGDCLVDFMDFAEVAGQWLQGTQ